MNRTGLSLSFMALLLAASASASAQDFQNQEDNNFTQLPAPGTSQFPGFGTVPDQAAPELSAEITVSDGKTTTLKNPQESASKKDTCVFLIKDKSSATVLNAVFNKKSGDTSNPDQSNFYGLNAAVVAKDGSQLVLKNATITTSAEGANAVFSTGDGTKITIKNIKIYTTENSSRGLDATYGGWISADNVNIETKGEHCAAFATDRGEGTVIVKNGTATTHGEGSPVIYSTGDIQVKNLNGKAEKSEIAVIEGKNSVLIENSNLTSSGKSAGIMLYQSMSGDAAEGTASLTVKNSNLSYTGKGPFLYVTNTMAKASFTNGNINSSSGTLIKVSGNNSERNWGRQGANGAYLSLNASNQNFKGTIECDRISTLVLNFEKVSFTGSINTANEGLADLYLDSSSSVTLTADCYLNVFKDGNSSLSNINSNGHYIYYNSKDAANKNLKDTVLPGGGKLVGIEYNEGRGYEANCQNSSDRGFGQMPGNPGMQPPQSGNQHGNQPPAPKGMPETVKITGTIKIYGNAPFTKTGFVTADGKEYSLSVMEPPENNGDGKNQPPAPPSGQKQPKDDKNGKHDKNSSMPQPPQQVSLETLASLTGQTLELEGFIMTSQNGSFNPGSLKDGTFVVLSYTVK